MSETEEIAKSGKIHRARWENGSIGKWWAHSLRACTAAMCVDSCHYVQANPDDPTFAPPYKADQIRKIFKRHYDWTGRVFPKWVKADTVMTDEDLEKLKDTVFGKCTNCRRCSINCPMGVDYATFNRMARGCLVPVGVMPEGVATVSKDQWEIGNQMGVLKEDYLETLEWLSEELVDDFNDPNAAIPIDKEDCEIVYTINPREIKYDPRTISDAAKIFYVAGENWTMPSEGWDMTNFGLFSGDDDSAARLPGASTRSAKSCAARNWSSPNAATGTVPRPVKGRTGRRRTSRASSSKARSTPCCATSIRAASRSTRPRTPSRSRSTTPATTREAAGFSKSRESF